MKKILSIALVALLAVSSAFAGFSGTAKINLGANFETGAWGFANSTELGKLAFTWQSGEGASANEGAIYAGIKGSFSIKSENGKAASWNNAPVALSLKGSISEAYVTDGNWSVSILGAAGAPDYANSAAIDGSNNKVSYKSSAAAAPGFKVTANGYTAALGAAGNWKAETIDWSAYVATPEYALAEGVKANFAVAASDNTEIAASAKVAYAADLTASLAADFGYSTVAKAFDFDIAANASYDKYSLDAYYWYSKKNLGAKAVAKLDLATITVTAKDILGKKDLTASASKTIDAVALTVSGGYNIVDKAWKAGASAKYTADLYTANASVDLSENAKKLVVKASAESSKIVAGATLKAAYESSNLLQKGYGKIDTSCTIAF
ncbi:MAG: hypothetical protein J6R23_04365 [Spirochaetales bacterium]|nr:hypothetical protein [Spirochaetales bacterium]